MKILQILPELNSGGVERGTLEIARALVAAGHQSLVVSNGGRLVTELEAQGSRHLALPVHRKSLKSLFQVAKLCRIFEQEKPDIVHVRSRVPAWIAWLALRKMDPQTRPRFVTTVHGFYSSNRYSAIMARGERVIAVSDSIRAYILENYPSTADARIQVIHRGVSPEEFPRGYRPDAAWLERWNAENPQLVGRERLLLPGRITRWKGHEDFIRLIGALKAEGRPVHGLVAGDTHPKKRAYGEELRALAASLGLTGDITFLGHRSDVREVMAMADIVLSLSLQPEAFGRVSLEAAALGRPVVAYDHGGVGEQLRVLFPQGLVSVGDTERLRAVCAGLLTTPATPAPVGRPFTQAAMQAATLDVYRQVLATPRAAG